MDALDQAVEDAIAKRRADRELTQKIVDQFAELNDDNKWRILHLGVSMILRQRGLMPLEIDLPVELQVQGE